MAKNLGSRLQTQLRLNEVSCPLLQEALPDHPCWARPPSVLYCGSFSRGSVEAFPAQVGLKLPSHRPQGMLLTWDFHTKRQRAQPRSCSSSGERLLLFHRIHSVPASCPHLIVLHSSGVQEEEWRTPDRGEPPKVESLLQCRCLPGTWPSAPSFFSFFISFPSSS